MVDLTSLSKRAKLSEDGEVYLPVAKESSYRLGVVARTASGRGQDFIVEVVLDPFPDRPRVSPGRLEAAAATLGRLRCRGYAQACDDAGTITCERKVDQASISAELREVRKALDSSRGKARSRRGP